MAKKKTVKKAVKRSPLKKKKIEKVKAVSAKGKIKSRSSMAEANALAANNITLQDVSFNAYYSVKTNQGIDEAPYLGGPEKRAAVQGMEIIRYHFETEALKADINGTFYYLIPEITSNTFATTINFHESGYVLGMDGKDQGRILRGNKDFSLAFKLSGTFPTSRYDIKLTPTLVRTCYVENDPNRGAHSIGVSYNAKLYKGSTVIGNKKITDGEGSIIFSKINPGIRTLKFNTTDLEVTALENGNRVIFNYTLQIVLSIKKR